MIIEIKVRLNTVQQKNLYDNTNTNIISNLFSIFTLQIDISHQVILLLLLYTTFVKRIIHKLMCSSALSIQ